MDEAELDTILKSILVRSYKKDYTLFVEGLPGQDLYIVLEGGVDIVKKTKDGELLLAKMGPGEVLGEMSLIDSRPRSATGKTNVDSNIAVLPKKHFDVLLNKHPEIAAKILKALLKILSTRVRVTTKKLQT